MGQILQNALIAPIDAQHGSIPALMRSPPTN